MQNSDSILMKKTVICYFEYKLLNMSMNLIPNKFAKYDIFPP